MEIPQCATVFLLTVFSCRRQAYRRPPDPPEATPIHEPFVSVLRPIKGSDSHLELCLGSTCLIDYSRTRFEIIFCVASPSDTAIPLIKRVISKYPDVHTKLLIGEEDVGPNPKIRNLSKAYREARGDILWILDCNIWVPPGILRRSTKLLEGSELDIGYKLVHHLPLCVDVSPRFNSGRLSPSNSTSSPLLPFPSCADEQTWGSWLWSVGGGRLEENFMSSAHAKFYWTINYLGVAPCIIGKSNLFRRSHLDEATSDGTPSERQGLLYFAENICEDHLLAEKLWRTPLAEEISGKRSWRRHGIAQDLVFQPIEKMSVGDYLRRRTRWIRVRKYAVIAATLAEPCTEAMVCCLIGSYGVTSIPAFTNIIGSSWRSFWIFWIIGMLFWALTDRLLFNFLHKYNSITVDKNTPSFIVEKPGRSFGAWAIQWIGREALTFGVWAWAMWPGEVDWRGSRYKVSWKNMKVTEIRRDGYKRN
ncbi:nucleotide-diphospho-sugar transferase [Geopyxis carbonaria]|nr:nucleotide-diphospho-sugar transferase [Geopyxis carbonaria]